MNKNIVENLHSILRHLKTTDGYSYIVAYFKEKQSEVVLEMIERGGAITHDELVEANARLNIYKDLQHFDKLVEDDLKL